MSSGSHEDAEGDRSVDEDFEELVAAALKVDPKGISGKHRKGDRVQPERKEG